MRFKYICIIPFLSLLICFTGCKTPLYYPNTINTPHFSEKNEAELTFVGSANGGEVQGSFSITENIAIIGNFNGSLSEDQDDVYYTYKPIGEDDFGGYRSHSFGELEIGKWYDLYDKGMLGCAFGYGFGRIRFSNFYGDKYLNLQRFNLQPYYGVVLKNFEFYVSSRFTYVDLGYKRNLYMEPAITLKAGLNRLKCFLQLGVVNQRGDPSSEFYIPTQGILFSMGLSYKFKKLTEN